MTVFACIRHPYRCLRIYSEKEDEDKNVFNKFYNEWLIFTGPREINKGKRDDRV